MCGLDSIQGEIFNIAFRALNWRLDHVQNLQAERGRRVIYFLNRSRSLFRIAYDATAANLSFTNLKLWLDERNDRGAVVQQRNDCG